MFSVTAITQRMWFKRCYTMLNACIFTHVYNYTLRQVSVIEVLGVTASKLQIVTSFAEPVAFVSLMLDEKNNNKKYSSRTHLLTLVPPGQTAPNQECWFLFEERVSNPTCPCPSSAIHLSSGRTRQHGSVTVSLGANTWPESWVICS